MCHTPLQTHTHVFIYKYWSLTLCGECITTKGTDIANGSHSKTNEVYLKESLSRAVFIFLVMFGVFLFFFYGQDSIAILFFK